MKRFVVVFALWASSASAGTLEAGYAGCLTKEALDEFTTAVVNKDRRQMDALIGVSCVPVGGFEFSVADRGILKTQVRVYVGDKSILLWVPSEAAR